MSAGDKEIASYQVASISSAAREHCVKMLLSSKDIQISLWISAAIWTLFVEALESCRNDVCVNFYCKKSHANPK
jgi:hypothetical protein